MNESDFKQRMVGAIVLIALGVIFIPILLNGEADDDMPLFGSNIPEYHKSITKMKPIDVSSNLTPVKSKSIETIVVDELSPKIVDQKKTKKKQIINNNNNNPDNTSLVKKDTLKEHASTEPDVINVKESKKITSAKKVVKTKKDSNVLKAQTWVIQVGSFSNKKNAIALQNKLQKRKYHAFVEAVTKLSVTSYRVRIGPEVKKVTSEITKKRLKKEMRINGIVMKYKI
ncbi:hypothetical protein MNBD_GAMMA22-605 [hydrothermal vent metagenome]|uniref:SPOR domain-containing protein n=1 Tax=hydrothermal vent metagenome TaxID=652676 RepID=A0A3B0ZYT0_9ZZZZ